MKRIPEMGSKLLLSYGARTVLSLATALAVALFFTGHWHIVLVLFLSGGLFWGLGRCWRQEGKREKIIAALFSVLLSAAAVIGDKIQVEAKNFLAFHKSDIVYFLFLFVFFWVASCLVFSLAMRLDERIPLAKNPLTSKQTGILAFCIVFFFWLLCFLVYYPGSLSLDSFYTLRQARGITNLTDYHPVLYTLLIRLFVNIGMLFGGITEGVAVFSLAQMAYCAFCVAYGVVWINRRKPHPAIPVFATLWFALSPVFADFSFTLWKDVPFAAATLTYTLYLWDVVESRGEKLQSISGSVKYVLLAFAMGIFRHNGYYVLVLTTIVLLICLRKKLRKTLPALLCGIILVPLVLNIFYACGVKKGPFSESLSIPVQQIARTVKMDGNITREQQESLSRLFDLEKLEGYDPFLADPAKNSINRDYLNENKGEFFKLWFSLLSSNFPEYCRAYAMQTYGYWNWEPKTIPVGGAANAAKELGVEKINWVEKATGLDFSFFLQDVMEFPSTGTIVWVMLGCIGLILYKRRYRLLLAFLPAVGVWLTILVATPLYCSMRYILAVPFLLPFLLFLALFYRPEERHEESE